jgi:hypothetical protein
MKRLQAENEALSEREKQLQTELVHGKEKYREKKDMVK